ncbi:MAG: hypothetical protein JST07_00580 [Bacteroidetes bacterium]|nr:hypothetical protein [Bacteroidota bacterium]
MKKIILIVIAIIKCNFLFSQIQNVNNYGDLKRVYDTITAKSKVIVVWGKFHFYEKYPAITDTSMCNEIDKKSYRKISSGLVFSLFDDSTNNYIPIKEPMTIDVSYKDGDIIKLKIRIYKNCKTVRDKIYFLIENIL